MENEFNTAIESLIWHKAEGKNKISSNEIKSLYLQNLRILFQVMHECFENIMDFSTWHCSKVITVAKKGDLSNPNNWRGINLLDVTSKLASIIINKRFQLVLGKVGLAFQFGSTKIQATLIACSKKLSSNTLQIQLRLLLPVP